MECRLCGYVADPLDTKCRRCGTPLAAPPDGRYLTPPPARKDVPRPAGTTCPRCGYIMDHLAATCKRCEREHPTPPRRPQPRTDLACPECGYVGDPLATKCARCGCRLTLGGLGGFGRR